MSGYLSGLIDTEGKDDVCQFLDEWSRLIERVVGLVVVSSIFNPPTSTYHYYHLANLS